MVAALSALAQSPAPAPTPPRAKDQLREPAQVFPGPRTIDQQLDAVFGTAKVDTPTGPVSINVRAYAPPSALGAPRANPSIPGPTFVFKPGDLLRIRFNNRLNAAENPALRRADNAPDNKVGFAPGGFDDIPSHVSHEISIPNNSNITNLHVHGLHVDPKQDNVTLLVLPEDMSPGGLANDLQRLVPNINQWWNRNYQYKIPRDHIPGTYWYHAHKHGSTSTQVENGMAGTLVMRPLHDSDDIVPGLWNDNASLTHDRVLMVQELTNFRVPQQGKKGSKSGGGGGGGASIPKNIVTVNGQSQPTLNLAPGQIERWRLIMAGGNHTAAGSFWVGSFAPLSTVMPQSLQEALAKIQTQTDANQYILQPNQNFPQSYLPAVYQGAQPKTLPGKVFLVAVDGIPLRQPVAITPSSPTLGGAGNRLDLIVQIDPTVKANDGPFSLYQNYPAPTTPTQQLAAQAAAAARYSALTGGFVLVGNSTSSTAVPALGATQDVTGKPLPNLLLTDTFALGATNTGGFTPLWNFVNALGQGPQAPAAAPPLTPPATTPPSAPTAVNVSVAPLLKGQSNPVTNGVDIVDPAKLPAFPSGNHQPMPDWIYRAVGGSGPATATAIMTINPTGTAVPTPVPDPFAGLASRVSSLSPAGTGTALKRQNKAGQLVPGIPAYVAPPPARVDAHRVVVFDRGQFSFDYNNPQSGAVEAFRQFWIDGRQFSIDDFVGNPKSASLIRTPLANEQPDLGTYNPVGANNAWSHQVAAAKAGSPAQLIITNPAYYRTITGSPSTGFGFDYSHYVAPTPTSLSGLKTPPAPPVAGTVEEWLLVNNSDLYHPFHIHINPFFVEEVGQLNYTAEPGTAVGKWSLKKITWKDGKVDNPGNSPFGWVVGNWWDVMLLPPHGYVKMKMWINVPDQVPINPADPFSDLMVRDNANIYGSWVLHCHILRHEDRGMMSMVSAVPNVVNLGGVGTATQTWSDGVAGAAASYRVADFHGNLVVTPPGGAKFTGTFNEGIGNPFSSQPYAGSMNFPNVSGTPGTTAVPFCVTDDGAHIVFANGHNWVSAAAAPPYGPPGPTRVSLGGQWTDDTDQQNVATITQTTGANPTIKVVPSGSPTTNEPVWWSSASGTVGLNAALFYGGTITFTNNSGTKQTLQFCFTADGSKIVFANGVKWTKTGN
jgi:FtsP/CotA-like multicopper oxidase with cupredoxin domain